MKITEQKNNGNSGNKYNGISLRNKKRKKYLNATLRIFGDLAIMIYFYYNWYQ